MSVDHSLPPFRQMSSETLRVREEHLLGEIRILPRARRPVRRRWLVAAVAVVVAALSAGPALAFSTTVRDLVGLTRISPPPFLVATVTSVVVHKHQPVPMVTVNFTVGEHGKPIGTGVPLGNACYVFVYGKPLLDNFWQAEASGTGGRYTATAVLPRGGVRSVQIGCDVEYAPGGMANGVLWLPVNAFVPASLK